MASENPAPETPETPDTAETTEAPAGDAPDFQEFVGKKIVAGILGILLGSLGIHKFMLGFTTAGLIMLGVTIGSAVLTPCTVGFSALGNVAMWAIGLAEGIIYLTKSDQDFYDTYGVKKKEWF